MYISSFVISGKALVFFSQRLYTVFDNKLGPEV